MHGLRKAIRDRSRREEMPLYGTHGSRNLLKDSGVEAAVLQTDAALMGGRQDGTKLTLEVAVARLIVGK